MSNLLRGVPHMKAGSVDDIRPALTQWHSVDGIVLAEFKPGGSFRVDWLKRFRAPRSASHLSKPEASAMVANLRKRGYRASYSPMN